MKSQLDQIEGIRKLATEFTNKYRQNIYIVKKGDLILLHTGDYSQKSFARPKLSYLKRYFKQSKIVNSRNDSIIEFSKYKAKKPVEPVQPKVFTDRPVATKTQRKTENPSGGRSVWSNPRYLAANSAKNEDYLTDKEKEIYYYLNLVRMNPRLFANTYLLYLKNSTDYYERSLYSELQHLKPRPILKPNRRLYESALCHASESGTRGYTGHDRLKCSKYFRGECCYYGQSDALTIITNLLVDRSVESLGHRKTCLGNFTELGVSIQPHKTHRETTVLDFK